jgi:hypothetical protein
MDKPKGNLRQQRQHIKKEKLLVALEQSFGIMSQATKKIGIDRTTPYKWIKEDEEFAAKVEELNNVALDFVESKLFEEINKNNMTGIIFYLKTKGKGRGYVERTEVDNRVKFDKEVTPEETDLILDRIKEKYG